MTEQELAAKIAEEVLSVHDRYDAASLQEQPYIDAVLDTLKAADVRLTLPYRLTPAVAVDGGWRILED